MFVSNCPHHVSMLDPIIWGEMEVASLDSDSATLTYKQVVLLRGKIILTSKTAKKQAVANWLRGTHPFQALDDPNQMNPKCDYD